MKEVINLSQKYFVFCALSNLKMTEVVANVILYGETILLLLEIRPLMPCNTLAESYLSLLGRAFFLVGKNLKCNVK